VGVGFLCVFLNDQLKPWLKSLLADSSEFSFALQNIEYTKKNCTFAGFKNLP